MAKFAIEIKHISSTDIHRFSNFFVLYMELVIYVHFIVLYFLPICKGIVILPGTSEEKSDILQNV